MEYINYSAESHKLKGFVCDDTDEIELRLFVDADLAGDWKDTKSYTGGYFVLVGPSTWFPLTVYHRGRNLRRRTLLHPGVLSDVGCT